VDDIFPVSVRVSLQCSIIGLNELTYVPLTEHLLRGVKAPVDSCNLSFMSYTISRFNY
jgi:hypothetical protein